MGRAYWVWIIPLSSGCTSVGIVAQEKFHSSKQFNTYQSSLQWLHNNEPVLGAYLEGGEPMDVNFFLGKQRCPHTAVHLLFETFARAGSAYKTVRVFRSQDVKFPRRHPAVSVNPSTHRSG